MVLNESILLVDDQLDFMDYVVQFLELEGYQVLTAGNGAKALAVLESHPVDLILADIAMPRMNGYQLYANICAHPQWVRIPFLFLTGRMLDSDIRYGKELGVDDYLTKPIELEDLLAAVHGKLRRARQLAKVNAYSAVPVNLEFDKVEFGDLKISLKEHQVWLSNNQIKLSAREFMLLARLAQDVNKVIPLQVLISATHNLETDYKEAGLLLRPLVRTLRRKLGYPAGQMGCIHSVRGVGYKLIIPHKKPNPV